MPVKIQNERITVVRLITAGNVQPVPASKATRSQRSCSAHTWRCRRSFTTPCARYTTIDDDFTVHYLCMPPCRPGSNDMNGIRLRRCREQESETSNSQHEERRFTTSRAARAVHYTGNRTLHHAFPSRDIPLRLPPGHAHGNRTLLRSCNLVATIIIN
jgi:hypothetical protein